MKKLSAIASFILVLFTSTSTFAQLQKGNPLKNIPVIIAGAMTGTMDIDDFQVSGNDVFITSTLKINTPFGDHIVPGFPAKVTNLNVTCDVLSMDLVSDHNAEVSISGESFTINSVMPVAVIPSTSNNDNRLKNTLCSIASLEPNASPYTLVAKLKQLLRAY